MNRKRLILLLLVSAAFLTGSCNKEDEPTPDEHYQISTYFDSYISSYPFGVLKSMNGSNPKLQRTL